MASTYTPNIDHRPIPRKVLKASCRYSARDISGQSGVARAFKVATSRAPTRRSTPPVYCYRMSHNFDLDHLAEDSYLSGRARLKRCQLPQSKGP
ncbi:uncharacterized protein PHACADRAFT_167237 [Phanerochaete carnosa HHB-10118-sp]|uniref:Uncharacterized protein n=1 Tax=Phanerochaete carnosa (strain HHB-10118-sp) TaxID=650164 RepID=K5VS35_PHACS|nr:uncharacterized protein PHACADRAFT_167237 [Phanerochaete carnosa HHB-10118-sp]EKM49364.1 hypothetical protein PHACADRAFT_167237 [Phanerochaete carnosa HHB-10118-sp]